jgi:hypothetical protein
MVDTTCQAVPGTPCKTRSRTRAGQAADLSERLAALDAMTHADLRAEWRRLYRAHPPRKIGRDLLELAVAWKLQETVLGGLSPATRRRLAELADTLKAKGDLTKARAVKLKPGARLVREWHGRTHDVLVTEAGFLWRGETWRSLTAIAREITGTHWSGPRFFGLDKSPTGARKDRAIAGLVPADQETADA